MSSEQSGEEGDEPVILVKPLLWRGEQVNKLFRQLEQKIAAERTPQARCQLMCRVVASEPSRTAPVEDISGFLVANLLPHVSLQAS